MNNWIDESREELGLLRQLEQAARLWDKRGRRVDELWGLQALKEVESLKEDDLEPNQLVMDFRRASKRYIRDGNLRRIAIIGIVAIALVAAVWVGNHLLRGELCAGAEDMTALVWNQQAKQRISRSFLGTGVSYAKDTLVRVTTILDTYTNDWESDYTQACEATHVKGEQSEEVLDLRMGCLRKRMGEVGALVEIFAEADTKVVERAVKASSSLTILSNCSDERMLRASYPLPRSAEVNAEVVAIREKLVEVESFNRTGKHREGLDLAKKLEDRANATAYIPVQAEVLYQLGDLLEKTGNYKKAEKTLYDSARLAGESGDSLLAAKALAILVWVVGYSQARHEDGLELGRSAEVVLGLCGSNSEVHAQLLNSQGVLFHKMRNDPKALEYFRESLAIRQKVWGTEHFIVTESLNNIGIILMEQGEYNQALEYYRKVLVAKEKLLSPDHPSTANTHNNIGIAYRRQGEYVQALDAYSKSLAIDTKALGPQHPDVGGTLNNMGLVYYDQGRLRQSLEVLHQAIAIKERSLGNDHPSLAVSLLYVGMIYSHQKKYIESLAALQRALSIREKALGVKHPKAAGVMNELGYVYLKRGNFAQSQTYFSKSLLILEKAFGTYSPNVADSLFGMGKLSLARGRNPEAQKYLERLAAICGKETCTMQIHCRGLFVLAQILNKTRSNRKRALEMGKRAILACQKMPLLKETLTSVNQWLEDQKN